MDEWLILQNVHSVYLSLFLFLLAGAIGLPFPEDVVIIFAGVLVQRGVVNVELTLAVCYGGILLGDLLLFFLGRTLGTKVFRSRWLSQRVSKGRLRIMRRNLDKHSLWMIFVARHLFYLRSITFIMCGALRMRFWRFFFADALAALISMPIALALGYFFAEQLESLMGHVHSAHLVVLLLCVLLAVSVIVYYIKRRLDAKELNNKDNIEDESVCEEETSLDHSVANSHCENQQKVEEISKQELPKNGVIPPVTQSGRAAK